MASETRYYYRGDVAGGVVEGPYSAPWKEILDGWDPVAVLPLAEAGALQRLKAAVEDDSLMESLRDWDTGVDAQEYRYVLRQAMGASDHR